MPLLARILRNWPLKLAALVLSLLVWVLVSAEETTTELVGVQVAVELPPNVALSAPLPPVRALVSGPGREILELYAAPLTLRAPMPPAAGSRWRLTIGPENVIVAPTAAVSVLDVQPRELLVDVDRLGRRLLPVALRGGVESSGWVIDSLTFTPDLVEVTGSRARVAGMDSIATEVVELRAEEGPFERRAAIDTTNPLLRFDPRQVTVRGRLRRP